MATNTNITLSNIPHRAMDVNLLSNAVTQVRNTSVTVGNTNTSVLALNPSRKFATFVNDSNETIYLSLSGTAVMNKGIRLNCCGGSYEINVTNLYNGAVAAICSSGSMELCITEGYDVATSYRTLSSDAYIA